MTVVLVTVAGPSGRRDLVVPADVPVGDLLGPVAAALPGGDPAVVAGRPGVAGRARWRLGPLGGDPLPPERSLATCGIGDGATLTLTPAPPPATVHPPLAGSTPLASRGAAPLAAGAEIPLDARGGATSLACGGPTPLASRGGAAGGRALVGWWGRGPRARDWGEEGLEAAIAAPRLRRCAVVGVVSAGAGIGRTTVAALLASVLAATRGGLTVAVDVHPGPGSLSDRLAPGQDVPAGDLLGLLDHPALTGGELLACLAGRPGGAGSRSASPAVAGVGGSPAPDRRTWTLLVRGLARHANALVLDCGPGLGDPGAQAAVATADQLVLVTEPAPSPGSRRVAGALADLGHAVVVVLAGGSGSRSASPAALARLLPGVRGVVPLPPPPPAVPPRGWAEVPPWWRPPARQLASLLAADWPALGMTAAGG